MATYFARKSGNINAADVWATTPTGTAADVFSTFTTDDILVANSFTVTVNVNTTVAQVRNDNTGGATAGGTFTLQSVTLTANAFAGSTGTCLTTSGSFVANVVGNITAGANGYGMTHNSSGLLTITGAVFGAGGIGVQWLTALGSLTIVGNVTGGSSAIGINNNGGAGVLTVTGNVSGGTGSAGAGAGVNQAGGTIIGTVSGGSVSAATGIGNGAGTLTIVGTAVGGVAVGANNGSTGTLIVTRAKGGPLVGNNVGVSSGSNAITIIDEIEYGDLGASPTSGPIRFANKTTNVAVMYRFGTTKKTLVDSAASNLLPSSNNVRSGVVYNAGQSTGTCAVPPANSVAAGVPVDNTVGTAILTAADFWNYLASNINTSGSVGERLVNCSTVSSVSQQLAGAL